MTYRFTIQPAASHSCLGRPSGPSASGALRDALAYFKGAANERHVSDLHIDSLYDDVGGEG